MLPGGLAAHVIGFLGANLAFAAVYALAVHFVVGSLPLWRPLTLVEAMLGAPCDKLAAALAMSPDAVMTAVNLAVAAAVLVAGIGLLRRGSTMVNGRA